MALEIILLNQAFTNTLRQRDPVTSRSPISDLQTILHMETFARYRSRSAKVENLHASAQFKSLYSSARLLGPMFFRFMLTTRSLSKSKTSLKSAIPGYSKPFAQTLLRPNFKISIADGSNVKIDAAFLLQLLFWKHKIAISSNSSAGAKIFRPWTSLTCPFQARLRHGDVLTYLLGVISSSRSKPSRLTSWTMNCHTWILSNPRCSLVMGFTFPFSITTALSIA